MRAPALSVPLRSAHHPSIRRRAIHRLPMSLKLLAVLTASSLLAACVGINPNEGVFVVNHQVTPRLSEQWLLEIRRVWRPASQLGSETSSQPAAGVPVGRQLGRYTHAASTR